MLILTICGGMLVVHEGWSQPPVPAADAPPASIPHSPPGTLLLTIFLRADQSKPLRELNTQLRQTGFYTKFPPPGIEVVDWYVLMGFGQVVVLRVPAERLREVHRAVAETAWGSYHTEFYTTYDYKPIADERRKSAQ
jgi:hypothetical protein